MKRDSAKLGLSQSAYVALLSKCGIEVKDFRGESGKTVDASRVFLTEEDEERIVLFTRGELRMLATAINRLGSNVNQIAYRLHQIGHVCDEIEDPESSVDAAALGFDLRAFSDALRFDLEDMRTYLESSAELFHRFDEIARGKGVGGCVCVGDGAPSGSSPKGRGRGVR